MPRADRVHSTPSVSAPISNPTLAPRGFPLPPLDDVNPRLMELGLRFFRERERYDEMIERRSVSDMQTEAHLERMYPIMEEITKIVAVSQVDFEIKAMVAEWETDPLYDTEQAARNAEYPGQRLLWSIVRDIIFKARASDPQQPAASQFAVRSAA